MLRYENHDWYFQVQGQLHITRRKSCVFAIWIGEFKPLQVENIEKDTEFFEKKMLPKLSGFYFECVLPELIDPRQTRNLPLRGSSAPKKRKGNSLVTTSEQNKKRKTDGESDRNVDENNFSQTIETCLNLEEF